MDRVLVISEGRTPIGLPKSQRFIELRGIWRWLAELHKEGNITLTSDTSLGVKHVLPPAHPAPRRRRCVCRGVSG